MVLGDASNEQRPSPDLTSVEVASVIATPIFLTPAILIIAVLLLPARANFRGNVISSLRTPHSSQRFPRSSIFAFVRWCRAHQLVQPKVSPSWLLNLLCCALNTKGRMLVGHDIVLVIRIYRLVLWRNVDFFSW